MVFVQQFVQLPKCTYMSHVSGLHLSMGTIVHNNRNNKINQFLFFSVSIHRKKGFSLWLGFNHGKQPHHWCEGYLFVFPEGSLGSCQVYLKLLSPCLLFLQPALQKCQPLPRSIFCFLLIRGIEERTCHSKGCQYVARGSHSCPSCLFLKSECSWDNIAIPTCIYNIFYYGPFLSATPAFLC